RDVTAAVFGSESLSYGELERRANRLAHHLQRLGVGPEVRVALLSDRSLDTLVAILGIWKAGGVYVPVDPLHQGARLPFVLAAAKVKLVLTRQHLRTLVPSSLAAFELDREWPLLAA